MNRTTVLTVLLVTVVYCLFDWILYKTGGNNATISYNLLGIEVGHPVFGMILMYTFSVLVGHLTMPTFHPPPGVGIRIIEAVVALSPIVVGLFYLGNASPTDPNSEIFKAWVQKVNWWFYLAQVAVGAIGLLAGRELVPQHVY